MVAIVSGNSLGLSLSSLATLGKNGTFGNASLGRNGEQAYVNVATGNLVLQDVDARLMGTGPDAVALRTYNSQGLQNDDNGDNWAPGVYSQQVQLSGAPYTAGSTLTRTDADGATAIYTWDGDRGLYVSTDGSGAYDTLAYSPYACAWTDGDTGVVELYDATGRLIERTDVQSNTLSYWYNTSGLLSSMLDNNGETLYYDYTGNQLTGLRTVTADGSTLSAISYSYDTSGRLSRVTVDLTPADKTDAKVFTTDYTYGTVNSVSVLASIKQSDGTGLSFTYANVVDPQTGGSRCVVSSITDGLGQVTTFTYSANSTQVTDPLGFQTSYGYDSARQLTSVTGPSVNGQVSSTGFVYNENGDLIQTVDALGHVVDMAYDANGNQTLQRDAAGNTITRRFDEFNRLMAETVYAVPDADGAGGAQPSAPSTTRYVYDDSGLGMLRFMISPDGRVTEYRYDWGKRVAAIEYPGTAYVDGDDYGGSSYVPGGPTNPGGNFSALARPLGGGDPAPIPGPNEGNDPILGEIAVPTEEGMQGWLSEQDLSVTKRTDFQYDLRGQLVRSTSYATVDPDGDGSSTGQQVITQFVYDASGLLLKTIVGTDGETDYTYDGLGRVLTTVDAQHHTTINTYDDLGNRNTVTLDNGLSTISSYDKAGRLTSVQQTAPGNVDLGITSYFYDNDDRLRMVQDPTGARQWFLHDEMGRKTADIDAQGHVVEYKYDLDGQLTQTTRYSQPISDQQLNTLFQNFVLNREGTDGDDVLLISSGGAKTVVTGAGNDQVVLPNIGPLTALIAIQDFTLGADKLNVRAILQGIGYVGTDPFADGIFKITDKPASGVLISVDPDGAAGPKSAYFGGVLLLGLTAAALVPSRDFTWAPPPTDIKLSDVRPPSSSLDINTWNLYDTAGRLTKTVDALGYVTETLYDGASRVTDVIRYAHPINLTAFTASPTATNATPIADTAGDRHTRNFYDEDGLLRATLDAEGYLTEMNYDAAGQLSSRVSYATQVPAALRSSATLDALRPAGAADDVREQYVLNNLGKVAGEIDGEGYLTEYVYDGRGNLAQSIRYVSSLSAAVRASVNSGTTVDSLRQTLPPPPEDTEFAHYTSWSYNSLNQLATKIDGLDGVLTTSYTYDAVGNVISTGKWGFDGVSRTLTQRYDLQGRLIGELTGVGSALLDGNQTQEQIDAIWTHYGTSYTYDAAGRRTSQILPGNARTLYFYNADGQLAYTIDALGDVEERQYDGLGELTHVLRYGGRLPSTTLGTLSGGLVNTAITTAVQQLLTQTPAGSSQPFATAETDYAYDLRGQLKTSSDALQYLTSFTYDAFGEQQTITSQLKQDGTSTVQLLNYDRRGLLSSTISDSLGLQATVQYRYDAFGRRIGTIDANNVAQSSIYDHLGRVVQTNDGNSTIRSATYDAFSRVLTQTDGNHQTTRFAYWEDDQSVTVTSPEGITTGRYYTPYGELGAAGDGNARGLVHAIYTYDLNGNLTDTDTWPWSSATTHNVYDERNRLLASTDANGIVTSYQYDDLDRITSRTVDSVSGGLNLTTTYAYANTATGSSITITAPDGTLTRNDFDLNGQLVATTADVSGLALKTSYTFDGVGNTLTVTDPKGLVTTYVYDKLGRRTSEVVDQGGLNLSKSYEYDLNGNLIASTDSNGKRSLYVYDANNRLVYQIDPLGDTVYTEYDAEGHVQRVTHYAQAISLTDLAAAPTLANVSARVVASAGQDQVQVNRYDKDGRVRYTVDAYGSVVRFTYDSNGNVTERLAYANPIAYSSWNVNTDPVPVADTAHDIKQSYTYDAGNRVKTSNNNAGLLTSYSYDRDGNLTKLVQGNGDSTQDRVTLYAYDGAGRQVLSMDPMGGVVEHQYDSAGDVIKLAHYAIICTNATLLNAARSTPTVQSIRACTTPDISVDRVSYATYDKAGRQTYALDAAGGITGFQYDANGNITSKVDYARALSSAQIAALGSPITGQSLAALATSPLDRRTGYAYDAADRLRFEIREFDEPVTGKHLAYVTETSYNGLQVDTIRYKNALDVSTNNTPRAPLASAADDLKTTDIRDAAGRVVSSFDAAGVETYSTYDGLGQLVRQTAAHGLPEASTTRYTYDAAGRVHTKTIADGTSAASTTQYVYDALGNVTQQIDPRLHSVYNAYDAAGRLIQTTNAVNGTTKTSYDAFGNAVKVTDPLGNVGYFYFDKLNRVTVQVDPEGYATKTTYWSAGSSQVATVRRYAIKVATNTNELALPVLTTSAQDALTSNAYDKLDRLLFTTDATTHTETTVYGTDGSDGVAANRFDKQVINKLGGTATYHYDRLGREISERLPVQARNSGNQLVDVVNTYGYDAFDNRIQSAEAVGLNNRVTTYQYDKLGRQTARIGLPQPALDASFNKITVTPAEVTHYDALGHVIESISGATWNGSAAVDGSRTLSYYDAAGNKVAQITADGALTVYEYDKAGHVVRESDRATRVALPAVAGGTPPTGAIDSANDRNTVMVYDDVGRLTLKQREAVLYWDPQVTSGGDFLLPTNLSTVTLQALLYDADGNVVQETDGRGNSAFTYYDKVGRKVLHIDQMGYAVAWDYADFQDTATTEIKYAGLVSAYARQDDTTQAQALRDPATLRAGLSLTDARRTDFNTDRMGRVLTQTVYGVATQSVDSNGNIASDSSANAVTTYAYDGLGNITQTRQLISGNTWAETDVGYDKLGREITRVAPGYTDQNLNWVLPETDTEYDGLGALSRSIQRGRDNAVETDDRITSYGYDINGNRVSQSDAARNLTIYELNAQGQVARSTLKDVLDASGAKHDIVKLFQYDVMGRATVTTDVGTGEVRKTAYNAFGEISAQGLGDGWQEYTEYNTLGKVQRSNTGDGVDKIYLYDRNGNTTSEIQGGQDADVNLRTVQIAAAAVDTHLNRTYSVYDKKNQLIKTIETKIEYEQDDLSKQGAFQQRLADLYGAISLANAGGGAYPGSTPYTSTSNTTVIGTSNGTGAVAQSSGNTDQPASTVWTIGGDVPSVNYSQPPASSTDYSFKWSGSTHMDDARFTAPRQDFGQQFAISFTLPTSVPALPVNTPYLIVDAATKQIITSGQPGSVMNLDLPQNKTRDFNIVAQYGAEQFVVAVIHGDNYTNWVQDGTVPLALPVGTNSISGEDAQVIDSDASHPDILGSTSGTYYVTQSITITPTHPGFLFIPRTTAIASLTANWVGAMMLPVYTPTTSSNSASAHWFAVDLSNIATDGQSVLIKGFDSTGNVVYATQLTVSSSTSTNAATIMASTPVVEPDVTSNGSSLSFRAELLNSGATATLHIRQAGTNNNWTSVSVSNGSASIAQLQPSGNATYEYILEKSAGEMYYGQYTVSASSFMSVGNSPLKTVSQISPAYTFNVPSSMGVQGGDALRVDLTVGGQPVSVSVSASNAFNLSVAYLRTLFPGTNAYEEKTVSYRYRAYLTRAGHEYYVGDVSGTLEIGKSVGFQTTPTSATAIYPGVFQLGLPNLSGNIHLTVGSQNIDLANGDSRRWVVNGQTYLNLSGWISSAGPTAIGISYSGSDANFNGTLTLGSDGSVVGTIQPQIYSYDQQVRIHVDGAQAMSVLNMGPENNIAGPNSTRVHAAGSGDFVVDLTPAEWGQTFSIYYETLDSQGNLNCKGQGEIAVDSAGKATFTPGAPLYKAAYLSFNPPAGASTFAVTVAGYATQTLTAANGFTLLIDPHIVPPATRSYNFVASSADGTVLGSGGGEFSLSVDNKVTPATHYEDRQPQPPLVLLGPPGHPEAAQMHLTLTQPDPQDPTKSVTKYDLVLQGVWDANSTRMTYTWNHSFDGRVITNIEQYGYSIALLKTDGSPAVDEVNTAYTSNGQLSVGGSDPTDLLHMQQNVIVGLGKAMVSHSQTYNAFGEVAEEYDDNTLDRANDMAKEYLAGGLGNFTAAIDQNALHTRFIYNSLGELITKIDAQTFVTEANGYVHRESPVTSYGYDLLGRLTVSTDANNHTSKQAYVGGGQNVGYQWAADGGEQQSQYDIFGDARVLINELTARVEQDFDQVDNLVAVRHKAVTRLNNSVGSTTTNSIGDVTDTYVYDALHRRISHTDTLLDTDSTFYDTLNRVTSTITAASRKTIYSYQAIAAGNASLVSLGGQLLGGYQLTTTSADGHTLIDRVDYFNRTVWHQDEGATTYVYNYNAAGELTSQTSSKNQNIQYRYMQNGYIKEANDLTTHTTSRYGYDNAGNRVWELYGELKADNTTLGAVYEDDDIAYDELNRISHVWDGSYKTNDVRYEYDAVGNRRSAIALYWDPQTNGVIRRDDYWYTYDAANRFTMTKGSFAGTRGQSMTDTSGSIVRGDNGIAITYDQAGQRKTAAYVAYLPRADNSGITDKYQVAETYTYGSDGYLINTDTQKTNVSTNAVTSLRSRRNADALGRTTVYTESNVDGSGIIRQDTSSYDEDGVLDSVRDKDSSTTSYTYGNSLDGTRQNVGELMQVQTKNSSGTVQSTTSYVYEYWDSAKQKSITTTQTGLPGSGVTTLAYDVNGHVSAATDSVAGRTFKYFSNAEGLVLQRQESEGLNKTYVHNYYYADGKRIGDVTTDLSDDTRVSYAEQLAADEKANAGRPQEDKFKNFKPVTSADFDQNYEPINASYPGATGSSYTVRNGDTLSSIAQSVWGDASMWYLIADANGLRGSDTLVAGQVLTIPNKVTNIHNNANTFRPYNPGEVIGHIDPTLPAPPPPPQAGGCGTAGLILMIVVAVVVTVITAGAAAAALAEAAPALFAGTAATIGGVGVTVAGAAVATAAGAALGSVASQLVGMATGNVQDFSWKAVGQAAIGGAISGGVGAGLNTLAQTGGILNGSPLGSALSAKDGWMATAGAVVRAGASTAVSMAMQGQWSWRAVALSSVAAGAGNAVSQNISGVFSSWDPASAKIATSAVSSAVGGWATAKAFGLSATDTRSRLGQAFAQGLGDGIGEALQPNEQYALVPKTQGGLRVSASGWSAQVDDGIERSNRDPSIPELAPFNPELQKSLPELKINQLDTSKLTRLELPSANRINSNADAQAYYNSLRANAGPRGGTGPAYGDVAAAQSGVGLGVPAPVTGLPFLSGLQKLSDAVGSIAPNAHPITLDELGTATFNTAKWIFSGDYDKTGRGLVPDIYKGIKGALGGVVDLFGYSNHVDSQAKGLIPINAEYEPVSDLGQAIKQNGLGSTAVAVVSGLPIIRSGISFYNGDNVSGLSGLLEDGVTFYAAPKVLATLRPAGLGMDLTVGNTSASQILTSGQVEGLKAIGLSDAQMSELVNTTGGDLWVFRGSRADAAVAGGESSQIAGYTPVTIDPLKATIFGLGREGMDGTPASVFFGPSKGLDVELGIGNVPMGADTTPLVQLERELGASVTPDVFAQRAPYSISARDSLNILNDMGLNVQSHVTGDLSDVLRSHPAMTPQQVQQYIQQATKLNSKVGG
ncbi:MAG TPA: LysM peptidoglycan-binding domain-containing protein [Burkholderiaceae bacterium]|jgi:YD repeat-containing protein